MKDDQLRRRAAAGRSSEDGGRREAQLRRARRWVWLAGVVVVLGGCIGAPEVPPATGTAVVSEGAAAAPLRADAAGILVPGEECVYGVAWQGLLPVGRVIYRTSFAESAGGRLLRYEGVTEASMLVSAFLSAGGTAIVHVDPQTFLPRSASWVNADPEDPHVRTAWFDRERGIAWSAKHAPDFVQTRRVARTGVMDPLSAIYLARVLDLGTGAEDVRLLVVEGADLHVMTIQYDREEVVVIDRREIPTDRLTVRTDRIDDAGNFLDEEPGNSLFVWIARSEGRPIVRMSGKIPFGKVSLSLSRRSLDGEARLLEGAGSP